MTASVWPGGRSADFEPRGHGFDPQTGRCPFARVINSTRYWLMGFNFTVRLCILRFNIPDNNRSAMSGRSFRFLCTNRYYEESACLAQRHYSRARCSLPLRHRATVICFRLLKLKKIINLILFRKILIKFKFAQNIEAVLTSTQKK